jgi:translation initiation factor 2B subunit (eIF-2B alpha/beta/delta family)
MGKTNRGMQVSGGMIHAEVIAGGENAKATKYEGSKRAEAELQSIYAKLAELEKAIMANAAELKQSDELIDATRQVRKELASAKPNKVTVTSVLHGISQSVQSVAAIAELAKAVQEAISGFM